jgi:hypothetical protein
VIGSSVVGAEPRGYGKWIARSLSLIQMLPPDMQERSGKTLAHWE